MSRICCSARSTAVVALIIGGAFVFNYVIAAERIPEVIADWLATKEVSPLVFLLLVNLLFLLLWIRSSSSGHHRLPQPLLQGCLQS